MEELFDIGEAVSRMENGERVQRIGWNGKNMFLYHVDANKYPATNNNHGTMIGEYEDDLVPYGAYIAMRTVDGTVIPWLCSQTDLLAKDYRVVTK